MIFQCVFTIAAIFTSGVSAREPDQSGIEAVLKGLKPTGPLALHSDPNNYSPLTPALLEINVKTIYPKILHKIAEVEMAKGIQTKAVGAFDPKLQMKYLKKTGNKDSDIFSTSVAQQTPLWGSDYEVGYRRGVGGFEVYEENSKTLSGGEAFVRLSIPLLRNGYIDQFRTELSNADLELETRRAVRSTTEQKVVEIALGKYWKWIVAYKKLQVYARLLHIAQKRGLWLGKQAGSGAISEIKIIDNKRLILDRKIELLAAEQEFQAAALDFSQYHLSPTGEPSLPQVSQIPKDPFNWKDVRPDFATDWIDSALKNRPDLRVIQLALQKNENLRNLADNQFLPELNLSADLSQDIGNGSTDKRPFESKFTIELKFPLPFRKERGEIVKQDQKSIMLSQKQLLLRNQVKTSVMEYQMNLESIYRQIQVSLDEIELSKRLESAERVRFKSGASNLIDVNLREAVTAKALLRSINLLARYQQAWVTFNRVVGKTTLTPSPHSR